MLRATIGSVVKKSSQFLYKRKTTASALTYSHKVNRLEWAFFHNWFQPYKWDCVIFSDEKKFNGDGFHEFFYYLHNMFKEDKVFSKCQNRGVSVMIWGCFSLRGKAPLVFLDENQDSADYITMLEKHMVPWADTVHPNNWIFQQDNASIHASRHSIKWFTKKEISLLEWPARLPDLNPLENLWVLLVRRFYADTKHYSTEYELKGAIKKAWDDTDPLILSKRFPSMPRRCEGVMRANGAKTKY